MVQLWVQTHIKALHIVCAIIVSRILYALLSWGGFLSTELTNRVDVFFGDLNVMSAVLRTIVPYSKFSHFLQCEFWLRKGIWFQMKLSKKLCALLPRHDICRGSNLESWLAIVSSESFADSSREGIVEQHVLCAQSPMHLAESAAPSGSSRLQSSIKFGSRT